MKKLILGTLLLYLLAVGANAASSRKIQFRTLCLKQIPGFEKVFFTTGKKASDQQELTLYSDLSPVIEGVFEGDEAVFYSVNAGEDQWTPVGKVTLGKSDRQLFLFHPAAEGGEKLPYEVMAFDDDLKSFALGSIRAVNLTSVPVRFILPDETVPPIAAGGFAEFAHSKKVDDYNMYPVSVEYQGEGDTWSRIQAVSWKASDRRREFIVIQEDLGTKRKLVRMFSDIPPWLSASGK